MSRLPGLNSSGRVAPPVTPSARPAAAPAASPGVQPPLQHPGLIGRVAAFSGSMAPRVLLSALGSQPSVVNRHGLLPPQFQSPAGAGHAPGMPATYARHSVLPPAFQSPLRGPVQARLAGAAVLLQGLANLAQLLPTGIRNPAQQAVRNDLAAAFGVLQRLAQDLASGRLGGQAHHAAPAGQGGVPPPVHPFAHHAAAAPGAHPQAQAKPQAQAHPQAQAGPQAQATPAASPPPAAKPVNVFQGDLSQARAELKASYGNDGKAAAGMHQMATELKLALSQGGTADLEAFQAKYQDKLQLPEDFASNAAAKVRLAKVLNESMKAP
jgi:hypothetical protein